MTSERVFCFANLTVRPTKLNTHSDVALVTGIAGQELTSHTLGGAGEGRVQGRGKCRGSRCYSSLLDHIRCELIAKRVSGETPGGIFT